MGNTKIEIPSTILISASVKYLSFIGTENKCVFLYHFFKITKGISPNNSEYLKL